MPLKGQYRKPKYNILFIALVFGANITFEASKSNLKVPSKSRVFGKSRVEYYNRECFGKKKKLKLKKNEHENFRVFCEITTD